jgi:hypothetical protein
MRCCKDNPQECLTKPEADDGEGNKVDGFLVADFKFSAHKKFG